MSYRIERREIYFLAATYRVVNHERYVSAKYSFDKSFAVEICYSKLFLSVSCFIHVQKKEFLTASKRVHYVCKLYYETNSIERHLIFIKSSYCQRNQTCNVWSIKR